MGGPGRVEVDELVLIKLDPIIVAIRKRRADLGWSQAEVARLAGTTQSAISDIETGTSAPTLTTLRKVAGCLGLSIKVKEVIVDEHREVNLARPMVDGKPRYQSQCSCGRLTTITSRRDAQKEQKAHRKEMRRQRRVSGDESTDLP